MNSKKQRPSVEKVVKKGRKPTARVFKTKWFAKAAKKEGIEDKELCKAVAELEEGKGENLGGNVWKKKLNENRSRSIVATKPKEFWVFAFLFAKNVRENIEDDELAAFKKLAADYGVGGLVGMEKLAEASNVTEICHDCKGGEDGC